MDSIWMGISQESTNTRVLAMAGASETLLKARLSRQPAHPRALGTLLEAIALWQGQKVRAAVAVAESVEAFDSTLGHEAFQDGGALYTIDWGHACPKGRRGFRDLRGLGQFGDLRQLVLFEVAR